MVVGRKFAAKTLPNVPSPNNQKIHRKTPRKDTSIDPLTQEYSLDAGGAIQVLEISKIL
jgi:hypothetical protein